MQQKELAIALKVSQPTISDWEAGRKQPSAKSTMRLASFFKVSVEYLLGVQGPSIETPTTHANSTTDDDIKFALFGDVSNITDAQFEEVKQFARFVKERASRDK